MAINFEKGIIFIHIPKTAGTSMRKVKCLNADKNEWHLTLGDYIKRYPYWNISAFFKFAFVRNPYDRFISGVISQVPDGVEFNEYCRSRFEEFKSLSVMKTQYSFVKRNGEIGVDFIGRYERIDEDWKKLCKILKIKAKLPKKNVSKNRPTVELLHPKLKKLIYWHFKEDFEVFGYEK